MFAKPKLRKKRALNNKVINELRRCAVCHRMRYCDTHEIFGGKNRQISIRHELQVPLCRNCHFLVTNKICIDEELIWKRDCQRKFEQHNTREDWLALIGENFLVKEE